MRRNLTRRNAQLHFWKKNIIARTNCLKSNIEHNICEILGENNTKEAETKQQPVKKT